MLQTCVLGMLRCYFFTFYLHVNYCLSSKTDTGLARLPVNIVIYYPLGFLAALGQHYGRTFTNVLCCLLILEMVSRLSVDTLSP